MPREYSDHVGAPQVDLSDLQNVVNQYLGDHAVLTAGGPLAAAGIIRMFTKSKLATTGVAVGGAWLAVQSLSTPMLHLMREQFGYLTSLLGS
jgi:hypothetical protein